MNDEERRLEAESVRFVRQHHKEVTQKFASESVFPHDPEPVSIFMAGSPGAGKTEFSRNLVKEFKTQPVIIDADEIRTLLPGYTGANSYVFQKACTEVVNNLLHHTVKNGQNFVLDATFAYKKSLENIETSFQRNRKVVIYYIYQDPVKAWELTKAREQQEHRLVTKEIFIVGYFGSRENVNLAKQRYGERIELNIVINDYESGVKKTRSNVDRLDGFLPGLYTVNELNELLK